MCDSSHACNVPSDVRMRVEIKVTEGGEGLESVTTYHGIDPLIGAALLIDLAEEIMCDPAGYRERMEFHTEVENEIAQL